MTAVEGDRSAGSPTNGPGSPANGTAAPTNGAGSPTNGAAPSDTAPTRRARRRTAFLALAAALLTLGGGVVGAVVALLLVGAQAPAAAPVDPAASTALPDVVAAVAPAVWRIQAGDAATGTAGTALLLTPTGDAVTNEHLVRGERTATLIAADGRRVEARVVATDERADLAWLRVDGVAGLPVARLAGPGAVRPGEDVVAIGNALNLDGAPSVTRGVVSAVGRSTLSLEGLIQTDAAISSGSSGGALVDRTGAVVGLTTEALVGDPSVSVEDIAFAIPADRVVAVLGGMGLILPPT